MKKKYIVIIVLAVLALIIYSSVKGTYNKMVTKDEIIPEKWSYVESAYQRRADLIPNLVSTVKGYADFEQETLTQVIEARSKATSINVDAGNLNSQNVQQFLQAQEGLSGALNRLMVVVERYPELKANRSFIDLQEQLERTENRINIARDEFNAAVRDYNTYIRTFPRNIYANILGFEKKEYFQAVSGAEQAPEVEF
ncbi:MAG: LemA family protein [Bacteroidales bacterium]|nr:LemA family protein [Bacteroidales bacterium]MCF8349532.1 LemA family protein [Bacteroidales bacterium]MCF8375091.1 LemA family protein [Bacteroidales bacterium]MCF8399998.1 LemA family protein [Bacteroidales bacterium]